MVLSRALTPAVRATPLLGASVATRLAVSVRRYADSPSGHDDEHGHGPKKQPLHKEEWLKVARNWPNEYHYPGHYRAGTIDEVFPPTNNYGHTSELPTGSETLQHPETFFSGFWVKVFLAIAGTAGIYRLNEHYTAGKDVHPITEFLSKYEKYFSAEQAQKDTAKWVAIKTREADDRLVVAEGWQSRPYRITFPGMFERASDHLVEVGSQVDVSDVKIKHRWQADDELFGPPYPKNK